jgi:hypothetical protein
MSYCWPEYCITPQFVPGRISAGFWKPGSHIPEDLQEFAQSQIARLQREKTSSAHEKEDFLGRP